MARTQPPQSMAMKIARRQKFAKRARIVVVVVGLLFGAFTFASMMIWPPINSVTTGNTPEYPDIQPGDYRLSQTRVYNGVIEVLDAEKRLAVSRRNDEAHVVEGTSRSRSGLFTDDMTFRVESNGEGGSIVFVTSRSRVGRSDFGQNARNIRKFFAALDRNLGVD